MKNNKTELRQKLIKKRKSLSFSQWQKKSDLVCQNLENYPPFIKAETVLAYFSFQQEPDLSQLFPHKQFGFPRCVKQSLTWHFWQPPQLLEHNKYDIQEPLQSSPVIEPQQVDLILVPTVACDRFGYRLGYGGGYYDRFLSASQWRNIPTMGVLFDFAYLDKLPQESWDIPLDGVCTESFIS